MKNYYSFMHDNNNYITYESLIKQNDQNRKPKQSISNRRG